MELPFIDAHDVQVDAEPGAAWAALARVLPRAFGGRRAEAFARAVDCHDVRAGGPFPEERATIVGFRVAKSEPPRRLVLEGAHRFSRYSLTFRVEPDGAGCRVVAETRANFPGVLGRAYRAAVIGTRGHVLVVRRLLRAVKRRAERPSAAVT